MVAVQMCLCRIAPHVRHSSPSHRPQLAPYPCDYCSAMPCAGGLLPPALVCMVAARLPRPDFVRASVLANLFSLMLKCGLKPFRYTWLVSVDGFYFLRRAVLRLTRAAVCPCGLGARLIVGHSTPLVMALESKRGMNFVCGMSVRRTRVTAPGDRVRPTVLGAQSCSS